MALVSSKVLFEQVLAFPNISANTVDEGNLKFCILVVSKAKPLADFNKGYQTGQTRNSIQYHVSNGKEGGLNDSTGKVSSDKLRKPERGSALFGATTEHAVYVEFGTRKQSPQPFIRPAIAIASGQDWRIVSKAIADEMARGVLKANTKREAFI